MATAHMEVNVQAAHLNPQSTILNPQCVNPQSTIRNRQSNREDV
jgi:hypothetical protein